MRSSRTLAQSVSQWASTSAMASPAIASSSRIATAATRRNVTAAARSQAPSSIAVTPQRAAMSTSAARWSTGTDKAKAEADSATAEAMGATDKAAETADKAQDAAAMAGGAENASSLKTSSSSSSKELDELRNTLKEKDAKIKELTDAVLYGKADMQNIQRRAKEEKAQAADYAITKFARDLTSSLDVLGLALRSVPEPLRQMPKGVEDSSDPRRAVAELYSGVDLTSKSIVDMLKNHGVTVFDPTGEVFDPQQHEAMYQAPVPGKEPGTVLECSKLGFRIKDRILRAAQVGVVQG